MSISQLARPSRPFQTFCRQGTVQTRAFRLLVLGEIVGRPVFRVSQFHSSCTRQKRATTTKQAPKWIDVEEDRKRSIIGPRYPQGATVEGLQIVVKALKEGPSQMHSREIWELIHERGIGLEFSFPEPRPRRVRTDKGGVMRPQEPEPSHPTHPVRSYKYMKTELLGTLEANGRIRKVRVFRDPITPQEKMELEMQNKRIAAKNPKKTTKGLGPNGISKRGIEHWVWELIPVPEGKDAYEERPNLRVSSLDQLWRREIRRQGGAAGNDSKSVSSEGLQRETETSDPHKRSRAILSRSYSPEEKDRAYGDQIASQWRQVTRKNLHTPLRAKPDMPEKPQWKDFRPNPIEPDDRQSRKKSDFAIGLMDARLRQHGFHYGLPKQKELLKAANARGDHDQKKWEQQPARDFSHLSRRRQKTREEQLRHTLRSFNEIKKVTSQKRNAT